jgi:hypothetical protein
MNLPDMSQEGTQSEEVKEKKKFERTKDPRFITGGKPCARLRFCSTSFTKLVPTTHATLQGAKHSTAQHSTSAIT